MKPPRMTQKDWRGMKEEMLYEWRDHYLCIAARKCVAEGNSEKALRVLKALCEHYLEDPDTDEYDKSEGFLDYLWWKRLPRMPPAKATEAWRMRQWAKRVVPLSAKVQ